MTIFRKKNPNHLQAVAGLHEADDVLDNDNYFKRQEIIKEIKNEDFYNKYLETKKFDVKLNNSSLADTLLKGE